MRSFLTSLVASSAVAAALLVLWLGSSPAVDVAARLPGSDQPLVGEEAGGRGELVTFGGEAEGYGAARCPRGSDDLPGDWPRFRGADFSNIASPGVALARSWGPKGPPVLWQIEVGEGHAGVAVLDGRVYLLDYDPPDWWLVRGEEIKDWKALCEGLAAAATPGDEARDGGPRAESPGFRPPALGPARRVWERLPPEARAAVQAIAQAGAADAAAAQVVLDALNAILRDRDFFDAASFQGLELPNETRRYLSRLGEPGSKDEVVRVKEDALPREILRLNRLLVDLSWPQAIARSRHGDILRCLSLQTGRDLWRYHYPVSVKRNHGMSRTVSAVTDRYVVTLGPKCTVLCLDSRTGEKKWAIDLVAEYGTRVPPWYAGQCPLIDEGRAILAPAGRLDRIRKRDPGERSTPMPKADVLMMAVECESGKVLWETPNRRGWEMTHTSIAPMEFKGRRLYVYVASGGVVGVDAATGEVAWETDAWKIRIASVATPVVLGDGRVFVSGGYGMGCMMLQVREEGGGLVAQPLYRMDPKGFGSAQQTPILWKGHLFGVMPSDGGAAADQFVCMDLEGKRVWESGPQQKFGLGPYVMAGDLVYAMDDHGRLTAAEASLEGFRPLASAVVIEHALDSWAPMAVAGGRLILRDVTRLLCLDISAAGVGR